MSMGYIFEKPLTLSLNVNGMEKETNFSWGQSDQYASNVVVRPKRPNKVCSFTCNEQQQYSCTKNNGSDGLSTFSSRELRPTPTSQQSGARRSWAKMAVRVDCQSMQMFVLRKHTWWHDDDDADGHDNCRCMQMFMLKKKHMVVSRWRWWWWWWWLPIYADVCAEKKHMVAWWWRWW